ncbi:MAG: aspartate--tRNA ligase [Candidatus Wallbacteria bacterium]|nr:aspartate--tRNA ligase [Candidatus Wallbacteria bacterium]
MIKRTQYCGEVTEKLIGKIVTVNGWVHKRRDLGSLIFILVRDRSGLVQVVFDPSDNETLCGSAAELSPEFVVSISGMVAARTPENVNPSMHTGKVEIRASGLEILNRSETPPFVIDERETASENVRLKYRYLDLRRPNLTRNMIFRSSFGHCLRDFLINEGFLEVETPIMIKSTPEGARDYLVPSRVQPGKFYALPQSPQLMKQLLMVAGMERYFQFSRCFRDEDLRADRQPEFTQIDLEMSFVDEEDVYELCEKLIVHGLEKACGRKVERPFLRLSYEEAIERFGSDKPDLRYGLEILDLAAEVAGSEFQVFQKVLEKKGKIGALALNPVNQYSRKNITEFEEILKKEYKIGGLAFVKVDSGKLDGGIAKFLSAEIQAKMIKKSGLQTGLIFIVADENHERACCSLGHLRKILADRENLITDKSALKFLWVNRFPLFELDDTGNYTPKHHIFSHPREEDMQFIESEPLKVHGKLYDMVLNGTELGSGSIRINHRELQKRMLNVIRMSDADAEIRFGFLLEAFKYGAPPHGGFAFGFDRLVMILLGETSIRDVVAFPKTASASCLMTGAPDSVDPKQLDELKISIKT